MEEASYSYSHSHSHSSNDSMVQQQPPSPPPPAAAAALTDDARFQADLEFVQLLSNPEYLNYLAKGGFFEDAKFMNYLLYLQYWKLPQYAKYILYPASLGILDALICSKQLRDDLKFDYTMHWVGLSIII